MTLKDLQDVLCGRVMLYEDTPELGFLNQDLYCGMSQEIPDGMLDREVLLVSPAAWCGTGDAIDIQLKPERKKVHRKSPA